MAHVFTEKSELGAVDTSDDGGQRVIGLMDEEGCVLDRSDDCVKCAVNGTLSQAVG